MKNEIPNIAFKSKLPEITGIEIIRLEDIKKRKDSFDHNPEAPHQIEFYKFIFYTDGETENLVDFVWYKALKNTLFYLSKGQVNAFKFTDDAKGFVILFTEDYFKKHLGNIPEDSVIRLFTSHLFSPRIQIPDASNTATYIELLFHEFYSSGRIYNKKVIVDSLYTIIFSKIEELQKVLTVSLKESDKLELFLDFQLLLKKDYAKKLGITYKHLNVVCKEVVQNTAKQFIDSFVILEAKRNLVNSKIKSTELAYLMGFEEPTNFVKYFKKHTGLTPNKFKNSHI